jgi:putative membrane protein
MGKPWSFSMILIFAALILVLAATWTGSDMMAGENEQQAFLQKASRNSAWKISTSKIALKQAGSQDVKTFGEMMISEHELLSTTLNRLALQKGVTLSPETDRVQQNTLQFLSHEYGAGFDRAYMSLLMDDNMEDFNLYTKEAETGKDKDIRTFAAGLAEKMQEFVRKAEKILRDLPQPLLK